MCFLQKATREQHPVNHPDFDYSGPDIMVFRGPARGTSGAHARNCVVMSNGDLDWDKPETWTGMPEGSLGEEGGCLVIIRP